MKQKNEITKAERSAKFKFMLLVAFFGMVFLGFMATQALAFEIITEEDLVQKTVTKTDFIKTADNFIVLMDTSQSMNHRWQKDSTTSKLEMAKQILINGENALPDLGYNAALYEFTPFETLYPMGPLDKAKYAEAINSVKADAAGTTFLPRALRSLEPVLEGASGKTVVFVFSDGTFSEIEGLRDPGDIATELAEKYNVCFYIIGDGNTNKDKKKLDDMARVNECSRLIPFSKFVENPQYNSGALYLVKTSSEVVTVSEMKDAGAKGDNILFDFDSAALNMGSHGGLDKVGEYLQGNPGSYVVLAGYTDGVGDEEYNLGLSRRRAESVAAYLMNNANVDEDRIVQHWFGKLNPVAGNDTSEGRAQNRRVEIAVGFE
jgi:outer membrane protein OmpA-like peptidoglycan-associated protein